MVSTFSAHIPLDMLHYSNQTMLQTFPFGDNESTAVLLLSNTMCCGKVVRFLSLMAQSWRAAQQELCMCTCATLNLDVVQVCAQ